MLGGAVGLFSSVEKVVRAMPCKLQTICNQAVPAARSSGHLTHGTAQQAENSLPDGVCPLNDVQKGGAGMNYEDVLTRPGVVDFAEYSPLIRLLGGVVHARGFEV